MWVPRDVFHIIKLASAKLDVTMISLVSRMVLKMDDEAWQAVHWARKELKL
jgi:hypothetical protein